VNEPCSCWQSSTRPTTPEDPSPQRSCTHRSLDHSDYFLCESGSWDDQAYTRFMGSVYSPHIPYPYPPSLPSFSTHHPSHTLPPPLERRCPNRQRPHHCCASGKCSFFKWVSPVWAPLPPAAGAGPSPAPRDEGVPLGYVWGGHSETWKYKRYYEQLGPLTRCWEHHSHTVRSTPPFTHFWKESTVLACIKV